MTWYVWFQFAVVIYNICFNMIGNMAMDNYGAHLGCAAGNQWVYLTFWGESFVTLLMFMIITQGVLMERVFYSIPHSEKIFEEENPTVSDHYEKPSTTGE